MGERIKYEFVITCVDANGDDITAMVDSAREVTLATFRKHCDWREWASSMGYGHNLPLSRDWHVSFHRSRYRGQPCYYVVHSAIEHVFCPPDAG